MKLIIVAVVCFVTTLFSKEQKLWLCRVNLVSYEKVGDRTCEAIGMTLIIQCDDRKSAERIFKKHIDYELAKDKKKFQTLYSVLEINDELIVKK